MKYLIIFVIALAIIGGFVFWKFGPNIFGPETPEKRQANLTIYGLWEDESLIKSAVETYTKTHPTATIKYNFQSSQNYRTRVQTQIKEGQGPDIFMIHNSWLPMFLKSGSVSPAPDTIFSIKEYADTFYPVTMDDFSANGKVYGVPRGIDGLALFYNEDILKAANVEVPKSWIELSNAAVKVTVAEKIPESERAGKITTAGLAMGTTSNVDHWSDIIGLLFYQQPGAKLDVPANQSAQEIIQFYTSFVLDPKKRTWDGLMENSTQAFASGKLAFYFAPSWRAHELRQLNPQLKFKTTVVPQLSSKKAGWASYWGYAVSSKSQFPEDSWDFLKFLSSAETEKMLYQEASNTNGRLFGLPYSRVDLQSSLKDDPIVGAFVAQGPYYKSWYLSSDTKDQGLNDEMIKYFEDAINAVLGGASTDSALQTASRGVDQVLIKYGVKAAPVASP